MVPVSLVLTGVSSSVNDTVMPLPCCLPDDHWQYQDLLQRVASDLQTPLEEIKDLSIISWISYSHMTLPIN